MSKLAATKDAKWAATYRNVLAKEQAYPVIAQAMQALYKVDAPAAIETAKTFENDVNPSLLNAVGTIYAENPKAENLLFFEKSIEKIDGMESIGFLTNYVKTLDKTGADEATTLAKMGKLRDIGVSQTQSPWRRFACAKAISDVRKKFKGKAGTAYGDLSKMLGEIASKETNEQLKAIFNQMLVP